MNFIFATHNQHKLEEVNDILKQNTRHTVTGLTEAGLTTPIPETGHTLTDNALIKARFIWEKFGKPCFSDDTGLEVTLLDGAPGVYSARYAGEGCSYQDNVDLLLKNMQHHENRDARFCTVVALIINGQEYLFEGAVEGTIIKEAHGTSGFGYDPIFLPKGYHQTFAEMAPALKNSISHRGRAIEKLVAFLSTL